VSFGASLNFYDERHGWLMTFLGIRRGDVPDLTADPALAEKELGFKASKDLETMCKDLWNWQSKNPNGYA
jgi:UDP-glucose 4-epimerase